MADDVVDQLVPDGVDWRGWARKHPMLTIGVAATAGFLVARLRGRALVEGVSALAAGQVSDTVQNFVDERIVGRR